MKLNKKGQVMSATAQKILFALIGILLLVSVAAALVGPTVDSFTDIGNVNVTFDTNQTSGGQLNGTQSAIFGIVPTVGAILVAVFVLITVFAGMKFGK